ncbi:hypothetical protein WOLCODRAFT_157359 [Wolfiporia cocos MD-104 SS10]|uniref:Uncharacterized protein n=1 Tax=Wolfiporia cocos (strain MD-104) TaxID=742152 RepID=A0A2H3J4R1_WOLCO|nr:hypothetical protein WOLCODRAFT_157359 [Wolfiporia cocos MD-104 SS10]
MASFRHAVRMRVATIAGAHADQDVLQCTYTPPSKMEAIHLAPRPEQQTPIRSAQGSKDDIAFPNTWRTCVPSASTVKALAPPQASARWPLCMQSAVRDQSADSMVVERSLCMFNMLMMHRALREMTWGACSSYDTPMRVRLQRPCGPLLEAGGAVRHLLRSRLRTRTADSAYETIYGRSTTRVSRRDLPVAFAFRDVNIESTPAYISVLAE